MAEIQDTDLMLVNRGGTSYKINGADVKSSLDPQRAPAISSVTISEDNSVEVGLLRELHHNYCNGK